MHATPAPPRETGRFGQILWTAETLNALADLQSVDRRALQMIYRRGLTQAQVAAELNLPEPTIRHCVARGMRQLAACLTTAGGRS